MWVNQWGDTWYSEAEYKKLLEDFFELRQTHEACVKEYFRILEGMKNDKFRVH